MRLACLVLMLAAACAKVGRHVAPGPVADSSCSAALDSLQTLFRRDYPGYLDKVPGHEAALAALTDSVHAVAQTSSHFSVCIPALRRWARFFRDPHVVGPWQAARPSPTGGAAAGAGAALSTPPLDPANRASITFVDDSTAVLRVPTFDWEYKPDIDSLVVANRTRLLATPYLIVDVRQNAGACTCSFDSILPFLYTGPIQRYGADVWTSPDNVVLYRGWLTTAGVPEDVKALVRSVLPQMEAHPNQFVVWVQDTELRLDTVYSMPRAVAVVVDGRCASSCEDFVGDARQSRKVAVLGTEATAGVGDYGNVRGVWLPGWRRIAMPTSRSHRLPEHAIDNVGITPDVRIPSGAGDPVEFARRYLRRIGLEPPRPPA